MIDIGRREQVYLSKKLMAGAFGQQSIDLEENVWSGR